MASAPGPQGVKIPGGEKGLQGNYVLPGQRFYNQVCGIPEIFCGTEIPVFPNPGSDEVVKIPKDKLFPEGLKVPYFRFGFVLMNPAQKKIQRKCPLQMAVEFNFRHIPDNVI